MTTHTKSVRHITKILISQLNCEEVTAKKVARTILVYLKKQKQRKIKMIGYGKMVDIRNDD